MLNPADKNIKNFDDCLLELKQCHLLYNKLLLLIYNLDWILYHQES